MHRVVHVPRCCSGAHCLIDCCLRGGGEYMGDAHIHGEDASGLG